MWQVCYFVVYLYDETLCISLGAHKPNRVSCPLCYMNVAMAIVVLLHVHVCSICHAIIYYCTLHWYHIAINLIWFDFDLIWHVAESCACANAFGLWNGLMYASLWWPSYYARTETCATITATSKHWDRLVSLNVIRPISNFGISHVIWSNKYAWSRYDLMVYVVA